MGQLVCMGAALMCTGGVAPGSLVVVGKRPMCPTPAANIMDNKPMVNILPFGLCTLPSNPMVAALTAAALGVPTPAPCIPATAAPWLPGNPKVLIDNFPALNSDSKCLCSYGGSISVVFPGQVITIA
ncbi:MAG: hypothetical protein RJA70_1065 [Pseudomonadota bacterium]|jgi:hypothetical protein